MRIVAGRKMSDDVYQRQMAVLAKLKEGRERFDADTIVELCAEEAVYEAQSVGRPLIGRTAIADYLAQRFEFFRGLANTRDTGRLIPAVVDLPAGKDHPCLVFEAEGKRQAIWAIRLDERNRIERIDILTACPHPNAAHIIQ